VATRVGGVVSSCPRCGAEGPGVEPLFMPELHPVSMSRAVAAMAAKELGR
jgi:hypothetical protein